MKMKKVQMALMRAQMNLRSFLTEDRGDTNFISIMIVLGIVLVIALAFIAFKDQIIGIATTEIEKFTSSYGG